MIEKNFFLASPKHFIKFFQGYVTSYPIAQGMCRPLLMLTFAFNFFLGKLNPVGYHILNLLFHIANGILLYTLIKTIARNTPRTLCAIISLVFLVHPLNTEAVSYISSRSDLISLFFMLAGILFFFKRKPLGLYACYICALLTKETSLIFIPLLIAFMTFVPEFTEMRKDKLWLRESTITLIFITVLYLFYRQVYFGGTPTGHARPFLSNIVIESRVTFFYLQKFFWPTGLNFLHTCPEISQPYQITDFTALLALISIFAVALKLRKTQPLTGLGITIILIALAPKFYAALKVPAAEHHFYTASLGMYIAFLPLLTRFHVKHRRYVLYCFTAIALLLATLTIERNHQLADSRIAWEKGVKEEPLHIGNWINLGVIYKEEGDYAKAQMIFNKALTIKNSDPDWQAGLYYHIAGVYFAQNQFDKTLLFLNKALGANPKPARIFQIYERLGATYKKTKNPKAALQYWQKASNLNPYDDSIYASMAAVLIEEHEPNLALTCINSALELAPEDFYNYFLLGKIREAQGDIPRAKKCYLKSIMLNPTWFYPHYALAVIYYSEHNILAAKEITEALKLEPGFKPAQELKKLLGAH